MAKKLVKGHSKSNQDRLDLAKLKTLVKTPQNAQKLRNFCQDHFSL